MAIKLLKPTTNGRRSSSVQDFSDITKHRPEKSLTDVLNKKAGRNSSGQITVRHRGGGVKRLYRIIDFKQHAFDVQAEVTAIEYDPNRGARIALLQYVDGTKAYIIAPNGVTVGAKIVSSQNKVEPTVGNRMPLMHMPVGVFVHNVEIVPGKGAQMIRSAGSGAQLQVIEGRFAQLKLSSGEIRLIPKEALASIGTVSNPDFKLVRLGKAGRMRKLGWRPIVRGKAMNPVDHPHGGGEGRNPIGFKGGPKTPWGKKALGVKTRKPKKASSAFIVTPRKKRKK